MTKCVDYIGHRMSIQAIDGSLISCKWTGDSSDDSKESSDSSDHDLIRMTERQLDEYFRGERRAFDLPLKIMGTEFQRRVWEELRNIPYGQTITYSELARRIGRPTACRAVANACGVNPLPIIIPCHRVVAFHGRPGGYTGGLDIKLALLALESKCSQKETNPNTL